MPNGTRCSVCHKVFGLFRRECARCVAAQGRAVPIGSRNNDQGDATNKRRTLMTTLIYADESQHAGGNASAGASTDVTAAVDNAATRSSVRGAALPLQQTAADRCQGRLMTSLFYADESAPPAPQATVSPPADEEHRPSPQHLQQQLAAAGLVGGGNGNVNGAASAHEAAAPTRTLQQAPVPPTDDLL
eukprot:gene16318-21111_t